MASEGRRSTPQSCACSLNATTRSLMPNLKAAHGAADPGIQETGRNTGIFRGRRSRVSRVLSWLANDRRAPEIEASRASDGHWHPNRAPPPKQW